MSYTYTRHHIETTDSTNTIARHLAQHETLPLLVTTDYQTAGRGQRGNAWESAPGSNLLFTIALCPHLHATRQFALCQHVSVALCEALSRYTDDIRIKWPNDIYWRDHKIAGILIEHDIEGTYIARSIIGVGLNVNQSHFTSDAPNPISLCQILGHEVEREPLLAAITTALLTPSTLDSDALHTRYTSQLYRLGQPAPYHDAQGHFTATLHHVEPDGRLILEDTEGRLRSYLFKEVAYVLDKSTRF